MTYKDLKKNVTLYSLIVDDTINDMDLFVM